MLRGKLNQRWREARTSRDKGKRAKMLGVCCCLIFVFPSIPESKVKIMKKQSTAPCEMVNLPMYVYSTGKTSSRELKPEAVRE